jgi:hypothetical protein
MSCPNADIGEGCYVKQTFPPSREKLHQASFIFNKTSSKCLTKVYLFREKNVTIIFAFPNLPSTDQVI